MLNKRSSIESNPKSKDPEQIKRVKYTIKEPEIIDPKEDESIHEFDATNPKPETKSKIFVYQIKKDGAKVHKNEDFEDKECSVESKGSHEISDDGEESSIHSSYDEDALEEFKKYLQKNKESGNMIKDDQSDQGQNDVQESE
jgi:hypothetical protein